MHYYLSPWEWRTTDRAGWYAPGSPVGLVDLRSLPECGRPGPGPQGYGFFAYVTPQTGLDLDLGDGNSFLTVSQRQAIRQRLGTDSLVSTQILDLLWELLTQKADPTGQLRFKSLMPMVGGVLELHLGGHSLVRAERFAPSQHPLVIPTYQDDYRRLREEDLAHGSQHYRQVLGVWARKLGVPWESLIPPGLPQEPPLPHRTTIGDTFVEAADTDLSLHTATGPNGGFSWSKTVGDIDVIAATDVAQTESSNARSSGRADSDLSTDDHYAEATATVPGTSEVRMATRFAAAADTHYSQGWDNSAALVWLIRKIVNGSGTLLGSVAGSFSSPIKGQSDGSTQKAFGAGVEKLSLTDTAITGNLRAGISGFQSSADKVTWDDFEAADLAGVALKMGVIPLLMKAVGGI